MQINNWVKVIALAYCFFQGWTSYHYGLYICDSARLTLSGMYVNWPTVFTTESSILCVLSQALLHVT